MGGWEHSRSILKLDPTKPNIKMQEGFTEITHDDITDDDITLLQEFERTHPPWKFKDKWPNPYGSFLAPYQIWNTSPGNKILLTKTVPYSAMIKTDFFIKWLNRQGTKDGSRGNWKCFKHFIEKFVLVGINNF